MSKECIKCNGELAMTSSDGVGKLLIERVLKYFCKDPRCALGGKFQEGED